MADNEHPPPAAGATEAEVGRGKYIVIEGPEAAGKSTQVDWLVDALAARNIVARSDIREPGGSPIGEQIRGILKDDNLPRSPLANLYLFNAARTQTLEVIEAELKQGKWVVCDRNYWSSYAYQVWGEGVDADIFEQITAPLKHKLEPDMTVFLMTTQAKQQERLQERGDDDYFLSQDSHFHARVRAGYLEAAAQQAGLIDGEGTRGEVAQRVQAFISGLIGDDDHFSGKYQETAQAIHAQARRKYNPAPGSFEAT
ncbi:dTMP kinase [Candidatus Saccharibacteria bacterium QS_8_54_8]|nr:MAG: dTMP kinase [Candidatus Saccharibacteria bacterium QS_8_54_8]